MIIGAVYSSYRVAYDAGSLSTTAGWQKMCFGCLPIVPLLGNVISTYMTTINAEASLIPLAMFMQVGNENQAAVRHFISNLVVVREDAFLRIAGAVGARDWDRLAEKIKQDQ